MMADERSGTGGETGAATDAAAALPLLIIASHGAVGQAALETCSQILGPIEPAAAIGLDVHGRLEDVERGIVAVREHHGRERPTIILVDLFGGSCANVAAKILKSRTEQDAPIRVIAGFNIPMIIEFAFSRSKYPLDKLADRIIEAGKKACLDLNAKVLARPAQVAPKDAPPPGKEPGTA